MKTNTSISFNINTIEKLFPFYIYADKNLKIISAGKSILKLNNRLIGQNFSEEFIFKRPFSAEYNINSISEFTNQVIILKIKQNKDCLLRGQILIENGQFIFLGSPWITSEQDFDSLNLKISDFAIHDGVTDMVQVLNTKEIITKDIIQLNESLKYQKKEIELSEKNLKNSNNRLSVLISNINGAILLEDENRKIILVNNEFCKLFNIPVQPEFLIGADCTSAAEDSKILFKHPEKFVSRLNQILSEKKIVQNEELELLTGHFLERDFVPIFSENEYHGHLWIYKDISQRKKNENDLIRAKETAINEKKIKDQFMANMSHELRNPLNIISGIVSLFDNKDLNKTQIEYLNIIKKSSENLLLLVNDILDFEKIEAKQIQFNFTPTDIRKLIKECIDSLSFQAKSKNLNLEFNIHSTVPEILIVDPLRLKQILINLTNNAIKFTEYGFVKVIAKSEKINNNKIELKINVIDSGIGIHQKDQKSIFKRFNQANLSHKTNYKGSGLGLTIVKNLIELQKGKISFVSKIGQGTDFTASLPCKIYHQKNIEKETKKVLLSNEKFLNVLVVEDNTLNQMIISKILTKYNALVDVASNGKIALELIEDKNFDIIIMDLQMPIMDGFEATKHIRALKNNNKSKIPIIALTANILSKEKEKCFNVGMNGYLTKPISEIHLIEYLNKIIDEKEQLYDLNYLKSVDPDDTNFVNYAVNEFIKSSPKVLSKIHKAANSNNLIDIKEHTHKLKGMFAYIGSTSLKKTCELIEEKANSLDNILEIYSYIQKLENKLSKLILELKKEIKK